MVRVMPDTVTQQLPPFELRAALQSVNEEQRTVEVIFSTGAAVDRVDWWSGKRFVEKLSLARGAIRTDRLNSGAPLLNSHNAYDLGAQIGVVEENSFALVAGKEARATVRFSTRADVEPIWQDVRNRVFRNVSVGYRVHKFEEEVASEGAVPVRTAVDWEPFELSMVAMGADAGAQVRAAQAGATVAMNACVVVRRSTLALTDADRGRGLRLARASGH